MLVLCYPKCSTCAKAIKWLDDNNIDYKLRNIAIDNPSLTEIKNWHQLSNVDIKKFFNTSGLIYKELNLKEKLNNMSLEEKYELLSTNGMLVKRPLVVSDNFVLVGFNKTEWEEKLK